MNMFLFSSRAAVWLGLPHEGHNGGYNEISHHALPRLRGQCQVAKGSLS